MRYPEIAGWSGLAAGVLVALSFAGRGVAQEASRYPYDPVCAWGRIANGKGMLVRCLTREEAGTLLASAPAPKPTSAPAPSASTSASPAPSASGAPSEPPSDDAQKLVSLKSIVVTADTGKLPAAEKKLAQGREKFVGCFAQGGLEKAEGEVEVRFLVSERGRAEGVSVAKRAGVAEKAAQCVADVVDRRWVGVPESPMVGATAVFKFSRVKK